MFLTKKGETEKVREIVQKIAPEQAIQPETTLSSTNLLLVMTLH